MHIAILGATGAVGQEMIQCLHTLAIPVTKLTLLASARSAGKIEETPFGPITIQEVSASAFVGVDIALFSAGGDISKQWAPIAIKAGVKVIDNSSAFRYEHGIPLVVPEINAHAIGDASLIANPNCTTAIAVMALGPLHKAFGLKKVIMATYQATSGAGAKGMEELLTTTQQWFTNPAHSLTTAVAGTVYKEATACDLNPEEMHSSVFAHPIVFNLIPHIDKFQDNGYTKEEMKVARETHKILEDTSIAISCTAVRIPTLRAHAEAITIETTKKISPEAVRHLLAATSGVTLLDDPSHNVYPMPINATGKYNVNVGRIRQSLVFGDYGIDFFICGDQLLRGAALNAVKIIQAILK